MYCRKKGTFHLLLVIPFLTSYWYWLTFFGATCFVEWKLPHKAEMGYIPRQIYWGWNFGGVLSKGRNDMWGKNIQMVIISYIHLIYSFLITVHSDYSFDFVLSLLLFSTAYQKLLSVLKNIEQWSKLLIC